MTRKAYIKKIGLRFLVINVVYFLIKLTIDHDDSEPFVDSPAVFYYITAFFLFMLTWEVNDWLIRRRQKFKLLNTHEVIGSMKIALLTLSIVMPVSALIYYLGIFELDHICKIDADNPWLRFRIDFLRATLLAASLSVFNQFYHITKEKKEIESSLLQLKKEMITSKYTSLKSQISPHFLFNSLNTLTSLMYEDRDLASDFVARLASCYRYILDNGEEDLVSLRKELQFLDSFIFMMKVRHNEAIHIHIDIAKEHHLKLIPTLSMQMLVENAFKHNYYSKEHPIHIDIYIENEKIVVKNTLKKRKDSQESTQLGLYNIKNRYAFYTYEDIKIEDTGNEFKVSIPLLSVQLKQQLEATLTTSL